MARRLVALVCVVAFGLFVAASVSRVACSEEAAKPEASKSGTMVNIYKCDKSGKTWRQPTAEKKACPFCGEAAPDCGTLVKSEPGRTAYTCRMHKFVCESKPGNCKVCNMKLVETTVPLSAFKKTRLGPNGELIDVSKEPQACEENEQ